MFKSAFRERAFKQLFGIVKDRDDSLFVCRKMRLERLFIMLSGQLDFTLMFNGLLVILL